MFNKKIYVNSIETLAALDGEGVRVAIFLQGCPLRCNFCHNPETWQLNRGEKISATNLFKKIKSYIPYFKNNGGVTLSGGEPLLQAKNLISFCKKCKRKKINIVLDTSGAIINKDVQKFLKQVDHVILDVKYNTEEKYKKNCKGSLKQTLNFLNLVNNLNIKTWVRTVVIPKINDNETEIEKYVKLIKPFKCVEKYELLGFHTMGFEKYEKLKIENKLKNTKSLNLEVLKKLQNVADKINT